MSELGRKRGLRDAALLSHGLHIQAEVLMFLSHEMGARHAIMMRFRHMPNWHMYPVKMWVVNICRLGIYCMGI